MYDILGKYDAVCASFAYHMHGIRSMKLTFYYRDVSIDGSMWRLWSRYRNQGSGWHTNNLTIHTAHQIASVGRLHVLVFLPCCQFISSSSYAWRARGGVVVKGAGHQTLETLVRIPLRTFKRFTIEISAISLCVKVSCK